MIVFEDGLNARWGLALIDIRVSDEDKDVWYVLTTYETRGELENAITAFQDLGVADRFRRVRIELLEEDED